MPVVLMTSASSPFIRALICSESQPSSNVFNTIVISLTFYNLTLQKYIMLQKTPKIWDNLRGNVMNGVFKREQS